LIRTGIGLLTARETLEVKYDDALVELAVALKADDTSLIHYWKTYIHDVEASMSQMNSVPAVS